MHNFNEFACIEKGDKSIFIAGKPDVWKDGKKLTNLKSKIIQMDSRLLFKSLIKNLKLK